MPIEWGPEFVGAGQEIYLVAGLVKPNSALGLAIGDFRLPIG